jgi:3-hydroxyisobutyrate dehydrogenase-like beta-hydroxyacid dehydrogenase
MGVPIAERLLAAGHDVAVWNRTAAAAEPFADRLSSPADAWEHGDVAITMLADDRAVEAMLGALLDGRPGTVVEMSTISVAGSARLAERAESAGAGYLRAPVTGNPSVVAAGNLGIIVSGPRAAYDAVEPLLRDVGPNHFYVGAAEEARVVKLAINLMLAGTAQLMAEALVLGERNGIDPATMLDVMGGSAMGSPFVKYKTDALVAGDLTSTFTTTGMYKDLALALECGRAVDVALPVTAHVQQLLLSCVAQGMGDLDFMALVPRMRREAGLPDQPRRS